MGYKILYVCPTGISKAATLADSIRKSDSYPK